MKKFNDNFKHIVKILSDCNYHDGSTIGAKLGITRNAVWKVIKRLQTYGIEVNSIKGKGYALLEPLSLLDLNLIKKRLHNKKLKVDVFETINSTNLYLRKFCKKEQHKVCLAEQQTEGKGRLNRSWYSPFGKNIYLSCSYSFKKDISELAGLSLVVSLAILNALKEYPMRQPFMVKWPNDIVYQGKKIAGTLIELQAEANGFCSVIIGVGINVNMLFDKQHQISQAWSSIRKVTGDSIDRNILSALLINNIWQYLQKFSEKGFSSFLAEWKAADFLAGRQVVLKNMGDSVKGKSKGVNQFGQLMLELSKGKVQAFSSGDIKEGVKSIL